MPAQPAAARFELEIEELPVIEMRTLAGGALVDGSVWLWGGASLQGKEWDHRASETRRFDVVTRRLLDVRLASTEASVGAAPAVASDGTRHSLYSFGGWYKNASKPHAELRRLDAGTVNPSVTAIPPRTPWPAARNGACAFIDERDGAVWVFGGDAGPGTLASFTPLADLWRFDPGRGWTAVAPTADAPPARWHAMMVLDAQARHAYLFGGFGNEAAGDTRLWDFALETSTWRAVAIEGEAPPSLQGATLTFDAELHALVLIGGLRNEAPGPATASEVWVFPLAGRRWTRLDGGAALTRRDHVAAYDGATKSHWVIGGAVSSKVGDFYDSGRPAEHVVRVRVVARP